MKIKRKLNHNRIIFLSIFLICLALILTGASLGEKFFNDQNVYYQEQRNSLETDLRPRELALNYQGDLVDLFNQYNAGKLTPQQLSDKVMALRVPADYKELHLKVVRAVSALVKDKTAEETKIDLQELKNGYWWLAGSLANLIANIY